MKGESHISKEGNKHSSEICIESSAFLKDWFKGKQKASLGSITEKKKKKKGQPLCKLKDLSIFTIIKI